MAARLAELAELTSRSMPCELRGELPSRVEPELEGELLQVAQLVLSGLARRSGAKSLELGLDVSHRHLSLTVVAVGASVLPRELDVLLQHRAGIWGGTFTSQRESESRLALRYSLPVAG